MKTLYKIENFKIIEVEVVKETDKTITIKDKYITRYHKQNNSFSLSMYYKSYDLAIEEIIKKVIDKKAQIIKLNEEINNIYKIYILKDNDKFRGLLY